MVEANPVKFYLAKFFFLAFSLIQWLVAFTILVRSDLNGKGLFIAFVFILLGFIFFFIYLLVSAKVRRVAVGKNKIIVMEGDRNIRFDWPEVKSLRLIPFFNLYKMKIRGKRNPIYFFPSKNADHAFGLLPVDSSKMGEIVQKKKKDLNLK